MENLENEVWLPVPCFEHGYMVSDLGRFMSIERIANEPIRNLVRVISQREIKPTLNRGRYLYVTFFKDQKGHSKSAHRIVAAAFVPNPENKKEVNHINGIKTDNRAVNLEWVTASENAQHAIRTGLKTKIAEANPSAKLTNAKVKEIRALYEAGGTSYAKLAKIYGVGDRAIACIIKRIKWKSVI